MTRRETLMDAPPGVAGSGCARKGGFAASGGLSGGACGCPLALPPRPQPAPRKAKIAWVEAGVEPRHEAVNVVDGKAVALAKRPCVRHHVGAFEQNRADMVPYARALRDRYGLPVYDIYSFMTWFHAGLNPRDFGFPGSGSRPWRER